MKFLRAILLIVFLILIVPSSSFAIIIYGDVANSTEGLGNFEGTLTYNAISATSATLAISLKNTSSAANGGYLTAFVFNNPSNLISSIPSYSFTDGDFNRHFVNNGINGMPYGYFDIGASLGTNLNSNFADGGSPASGIAVGNTETFTFNLAGTGLNGLTDQSFVDALSTGASPDYGNQFFVARFRGFNNGGSDKVPATTSNPVPEPASILLFGSSLLGLIGFKRRK